MPLFAYNRLATRVFAFHTFAPFMAQAFPKIGSIKFEGPKSKNPLAFKHYNANEKVEGKTMRDHLRFSIVYWHTMCG
jgi:xylose isomerase